MFFKLIEEKIEKNTTQLDKSYFLNVKEIMTSFDIVFLPFN